MVIGILKKLRIWPFILAMMIFFPCVSYAQKSGEVYFQKYQNGIQLYHSSFWNEAAVEFRRAQEIAVDTDDWSRAIYWVILCELARSDYGSAVRDMDELQKKAPATVYARDMVYHRGRVYFNQGYFEEALILFRRYLDSVQDTNRESEDRRAAAFFWMGECLYSISHFDEAQKFYAWVINRYPLSPKVDIASYRIDLIKQKKIENELLALLQWSHEESLRSNEDYLRQIKMYEYTLNQYQKRIAELSGGSTDLAGQGKDSRIEIDDFDLTEDNWQSVYERLLERARRLNIELENMINESGGGSW